VVLVAIANAYIPFASTDNANVVSNVQDLYFGEGSGSTLLSSY